MGLRKTAWSMKCYGGPESVTPAPIVNKGLVACAYNTSAGLWSRGGDSKQVQGDWSWFKSPIVLKVVL